MKSVKNKLDGWLVINKGYEIGSTSVVNKLKWILKPEKIGHAGTLDPLATGVLPIALGKATKTIPYVMDGKKTYEFEVTWGSETNTDDLEGEVIFCSQNRPTRNEIENILPQFQGNIQQIPPIYSAVKINGKRAYELARNGEDIVLQPRSIKIDSLKIIEYTPEKTLFEVVCGKGTYVRSLGHDMGRILGCYGHITQLKRTKCGPFTLSQSIMLDYFENKEYNENALKLIPVLTALDDILVLAVNGEQTQALVQGRRLSARLFTDNLLNVNEGDVLKAVFNNQLIALVKYENKAIKPFKVFASLV